MVNNHIDQSAGTYVAKPDRRQIVEMYEARLAPEIT